MSPRQARHEQQRDVGRVMGRLTLLRDKPEEVPDQSGGGRSSLLVSIRAKSNPGNGKGGAKPQKWWLGPSGNPLDDELANAAGLELERVVTDFADWMVESYLAIRNMRREFNARTFPDAAASRSKDAMVSIGDGGNYLGKIIPEDGDEGTRSVEFQYPGLGVLTVRQHYSAAKQRFENLDVTFTDPETGEEITETLPSSRFTLQSRFAGGDAGADTRVGAANVTGPNETTGTGGHAGGVPPNGHRPAVLPGRPSDPIPVPQLPPSEPGRGRELVPDHTGGNQTDLGPLTELAPGFPAQEQEPLIHITPDQREELLEYQALLQANTSDDDEVKLPAGLTEADLKPAKQNRDLAVMSSKGDVWSAKAGMTAIENLEDHFDSHINEFPDVTSPMEYALAAKKFLENPPRGVQAKIRENGDILLYDPASRTFGVRDVNGVPRTFFKPDPPKIYWDEQ